MRDEYLLNGEGAAAAAIALRRLVTIGRHDPLPDEARQVDTATVSVRGVLWRFHSAGGAWPIRVACVDVPHGTVFLRQDGAAWRVSDLGASAVGARRMRDAVAWPRGLAAGDEEPWLWTRGARVLRVQVVGVHELGATAMGLPLLDEGEVPEAICRLLLACERVIAGPP